MGYDVTFHPFDRTEFKYYVNDVVENPREYAKQVERIHDDETERSFVGDELYGKWAEFKDRIAAGESFGNTLGFSIAGVLGYLHPYWYSRGGLLSNLLMHETFGSFSGNLSELVAEANRRLFEANSGTIEENYCSGCYIPNEKISALIAAIENESNRPAVEETIGDYNLAALLRCLNYCVDSRLDLLETTDLYVPAAGRCSTLPGNMRAGYLKNIDDTSNHSRKSASLE